jgi:hypothetical protein
VGVPLDQHLQVVVSDSTVIAVPQFLRILVVSTQRTGVDGLLDGVGMVLLVARPPHQALQVEGVAAQNRNVKVLQFHVPLGLTSSRGRRGVVREDIFEANGTVYLANIISEQTLLSF